MFKILMSTKRFAPLFWCQFLSAFNDNFLRHSLFVLIVFQFSDDSTLLPLVPAIFILPSFLLSALGGELADRYNKALIAQRLKLAELPIAILAVVGLWFHSVPCLFIALFGFGCIAALFGPLKYGILPDHLKESELPAGNALVEMATFIAILLGMISSGMAMQNVSGTPWIFGIVIIGFAASCWFSALFIPETKEASPELIPDCNIFRSTWKLLGILKSYRILYFLGLSLSWFWLIGVVMMTIQANITKSVLLGTPGVLTFFVAMFAIGIAVGSSLASWLASGRIILLPAPIAAFFMALFCFDIGFALSRETISMSETGLEFFSTFTGMRLAFDFFGLATAGGLYVVPTFAALQAWAPLNKRSQLIAAVNVVTSAFIALGAVLMVVLPSIGTIAASFLPLSTEATQKIILLFDLSIAQICYVFAILNLIVAYVIFRRLPTPPFHDLLSMIFRAFFRTEVKGLENLKKAGKNPIIALNHVSFLDAALAISFLDKEPVFAIDYSVAQRWWVRPFLKLVRALPLDPTKPMATRSLINAVKAGETLVIFPEGRLTVTGALMKVYDGVGLIADKTDSLVVPVKIDGLEQTLFSRLKDSQIKRRWWPKVTVTILEPVKLEVQGDLRGKARRIAAGSALYNIMSDMVYRTAQKECSIFNALVQSVQKNGKKRIAIEDPVSGAMSYRKMLTSIRILAQKMVSLADENGSIGILLPNANASIISVFAVMSAGRIPAMLNFTAGAANIASGCLGAQIKTIVTSRAFIEKGKMLSLIESLKGKVSIVYLEDIGLTVTFLDKVKGFWGWKKPLIQRNGIDPAAILFTSGSEGTPKGVVLSSRNILANVAQAEARIDFGREDKVFNVMPLFHSFGLSIGTILPLVCGVPVYLYPSPLHYRIVPELIYSTNSTILFGTDTFLAGYARTAHPYDFRSLRFIVAGAEPVKLSTRLTYLEKFGLRIFEGYGVTETAPVLALNTPMFNRFGTVGRLFPGIKAKLEPVPGINDGGKLLVKGPNIMLGYLKAEKPGILLPPEEGWYDTGDIVSIDDQGFITIKGRAKRFAKVGGEMVSLASVDSLAAELWADSLSASTSLPDEKKGEKVILFTEHKGATRKEYQSFAWEKGIAEIMIPAQVIVIDKIPLLGSGKTDFAAVNRLAKEKFS